MKTIEERNKFYENKKVLVTGADGFVGSHLTEKLLSLGAKMITHVRGTSVSGTTRYTLKNISHLEKKLEKIIAGDIGSKDSVDLIAAEKPQIIFHLAAIAYVPFSFEHPREVMEANLIGTMNVLEAGMKCQVERIVVTSSSEIYGTAQREKIDEEHPLNPSSPYAASKLAADRYAYAYWNTYKLPVAIIRPFNTYGPRHTYDVIPKFIDLALKDEPLTIYGVGTQSRDFMYVDDTVDAFLFMGFHPKAIGQAVNFGTGKDVDINTLAELIVELSGSKSRIIHVEARTSEVKKLLCDYSKAKSLLGWEPKVDITEGLRKNIEYVKGHLI
jgi:nucleoside-diphosphate-sugar epimerase